MHIIIRRKAGSLLWSVQIHSELVLLINWSRMQPKQRFPFMEGRVVHIYYFYPSFLWSWKHGLLLLERIATMYEGWSYQIVDLVIILQFCCSILPRTFFCYKEYTFLHALVLLFESIGLLSFLLLAQHICDMVGDWEWVRYGRSRSLGGVFPL